MSEAKYRIPRMAMAVMVLGANGCGDDDGGGGGKTADPATRVQNLAKGACKLAFSCTTGPWSPDEEEDRDFDTEQECIEQFVADSKEAISGITTACRDAYLDYYECYVSTGCGGDTKGKCKASYQTYVDACKDQF